MPSPPHPDQWPPEVADDHPVKPVDDSYASEFLSETSPEFDAVRRAAADARIQPAPSVPAGRPLPPPSAATSTRPANAAPYPRFAVYAGAAAVILVVAWLFRAELSVWPIGSASGPPAREGVATIVSRPEGAEVFIDGQWRGVTPLQLTLPVGAYPLELRNGAATRSLTLTVEAATSVRETVDLAPIATTGRLEVTSDTPGAAVAIDGVSRGVTPLVVEDVAPGTRRITIGTGSAAVNRTVTIEAGATATVMASPVPTGTSGGWLTFTAPIEMRVVEDGQVLGTTRASRLMVPAGRHELELVADPYEFRTTATATVGVGRTVTVPVAVPDGRLSINAVPWAEVWLDGRPLGSTPLANLSVPIGDHEVVWRHPQLGERRQTVRVAVKTPARVGVDLNR